MKTKDLIRVLMELDPSGEEQVCVGNSDIHYVDRLPAYYDGTMQVLLRDNSKWGYSIVGGKYVRSGVKISIVDRSIEDALWDDPDMPVDYSELSPNSQVEYRQRHEEIKRKVAEIETECEWENFWKWVQEKQPEAKAHEPVAKAFFNVHISRKDPLPNGRVLEGHSYNTTRQVQWNKKYNVTFSTSGLEIKCKSEE